MRFACVAGIALAASFITQHACAQSANVNQARVNSARMAEITIGTNPQQSISPTFMGIAHEWGDAKALMGDTHNGVNTVYRHLLTNLTAYGSSPIVIRIGGNSTDTSTALSSASIQPFAELAAATGAHFYLGVNLGSGNVQVAVNQAKAMINNMPAHSLDAIEIGNEPDSYVDKGMRRPPYSFADYQAEFDTWRMQISPLLAPATRLLGPSWAYPASLRDAATFLDAEQPYLLALTQHYYVGNACKGNTNPADTLLQPRNTTDAPARMQSAASIAHAQHISFRVDELNSIACGGEDGVSNTFSAALWAIDIMFEFARAGVDGINWQSPNGAVYSLFNFDISHSANRHIYILKTINPLYYGLLFFQATTGDRTSLLPISLHTDANLKAWATLDSMGHLRLAVINKDTAAVTVRIVQPGYHSASILRLTAPSPNAKTGVAIAGQTMDGSPDGKLQGTSIVETAHLTGDTFELSIPGTSAMLVTFHP